MTRSPRWRKVGVLLALLDSVSALLHPWDSGAPARLVAVGVALVSVAVDPRTAHVFVANWGDNTVSVLDAAGGRVRRVVAVGHTPFAVAVDGRAARAFVLASNPGSVSVLATTTGTAMRTVPPQPSSGAALTARILAQTAARTPARPVARTLAPTAEQRRERRL